VALGAGFQVGAVTAAADIDVRGPSDTRTLDFVALARNLSTADLATFLNVAFDAGLAAPTNPSTLDCLTVAFSTGEAASFDITGAFSAGMDAADALAALAELLPGAGPPSPPPFSLGTLAGAWFELHVVADSVWGGYGGGVELGGSGGSGLLGTASVRMGVSNAGGEDWVALDMELSASDLSVSDAVDALAEALPGGWSIPSTFESATDVTLDAARARVGFDTRADSAAIDLSGTGLIDGPNGALAASAALRLFDVADARDEAAHGYQSSSRMGPFQLRGAPNLDRYPDGYELLDAGRAILGWESFEISGLEPGRDLVVVLRSAFAVEANVFAVSGRHRVALSFPEAGLRPVVGAQLLPLVSFQPGPGWSEHLLRLPRSAIPGERVRQRLEGS
jgi:hypothetical protein